MSTLQIGFFGLRNAGKTVGATLLYLTESGDGLNVTVRDPETIKYLRPLADALELGEVPQPTMGPPTRLRWRVEVGSARHDLETTDFPGELLEAIGQEGDPVNEEAMARFRNRVRDWFVHCDAVLLFVDSTQKGTVRYRDALVRILDEMSRRPTRRGSAARAVGVVFTKGDLLARSPQLLSDDDAVHGLLAQHPLYGVVRRRLDEQGDRFTTQVFLSSALGWNFLTVSEKGRRKVEPCNWFAAVRWAVEQGSALVAESHRQVLDELEQEIAKKGGEQRAGLLTNFRRLLRWLDDAEQDFRLSTGPCADRYFALRQRLLQARKGQRRSWALVGAILVLALLGMGYRYGRQTRLIAYDAYERLHVERPGEAAVRERLAYYDEKIASRRHDGFWLAADRRRAADALAESDRVLLRRVAAEEAFLVWFAGDERDDRAGRPAHRHVAATVFLQKHEGAARCERVEAVRRVVEQTRPAFEADQAAFQRLKASALAPVARSDEFAERIKDVTSYADGRDALQAEQARALAREILLHWDRCEYVELRGLRDRSAGPESFAPLESAAKDYLRPDRHPRKMAGQVQTLVQGIEEMRKGKDYWVLVNRVVIPPGSELIVWTGNPNCSVRVALGGQVHETKKVKPAKAQSDGGFTIDFNERIGPFHATWGPEQATVTLVTNREFFSNNVASRTLDHDLLVMSQFVGKVDVKDRKDRMVAVITDCKEARLAELPSFK
jgi:hypothetical protein